MRGINKVFILGRLGKDIILQQTKTGRSLVELWIATNRPIQKDGEWSSETDWHAVRFWGKQAETCAKYLGKGSPIALEGSLRSEQWITNDGEKRSRNYIIGSELYLLPGRTPLKLEAEPLTA